MTLRAAAPALLGLVIGSGIAALAGFGPGAWRAPTMGAAAGLLGLGLARLGGLARREWRRDPPPIGAYRRAAVPFLAALVLAGLATA